jgi:hypothetical protein
MLKFMLWPFVLLLISLALVAVFSVKGSVVSITAKNLVSVKESSWPFIVDVVIYFAAVAGIGWISWHAVDIVNRIFGMIIFSALALVGIVMLLVISLAHLFVEAAPVAAKIGEKLTDAQRRSTYRRTIKFFQQFKNWKPK